MQIFYASFIWFTIRPEFLLQIQAFSYVFISYSFKGLRILFEEEDRQLFLLDRLSF